MGRKRHITEKKERYYKNITRRLNDLLEENKLSGREFATRIGVDPSTVLKWRRGETYPRINHVAKIAEVFNVSLDYLCGLTENKDGSRG